MTFHRSLPTFHLTERLSPRFPSLRLTYTLWDVRFIFHNFLKTGIFLFDP
jgi:hypothetical protein